MEEEGWVKKRMEKSERDGGGGGGGGIEVKETDRVEEDGRIFS